MFLNVRLKTHQKRVIYYEKGYIKMKRENINPNNYHLFENEVISIKIETSLFIKHFVYLNISPIFVNK